MRGRLVRVMLLGAIAIVCALAVARVPSFAAEAPEPVDARIQVVWPHGVTPPRQMPPEPLGSLYVNVEVALFRRGTREPVPCDFDAPVRLGWTTARGADPDFARRGTREVRIIEGRRLPVWMFNDVLVRGRSAYFFVKVDGVDARTNVWWHWSRSGDDLPRPDAPLPMVYRPENSPLGVDTHLTIVGAEPVDPRDPGRPARSVHVEVTLRAREPPLDRLYRPPADERLNDIMLFWRTTEPWRPAAPDRNRSVRLFRALNDGMLEMVGQAPFLREVHGLGANKIPAEPEAYPYPRAARPEYPPTPVSWTVYRFENVEVPALPLRQGGYFFAARVLGEPSFLTIHPWGVIRPFPHRDVPTRGCDESA